MTAGDAGTIWLMAAWATISSTAAPGLDTLFGEEGHDRLFGGDHRDLIYGGDGDDRIEGGAGDDTLMGGQGADLLIGGDGFDTVSYAEGRGYTLILHDVTLNRADAVGRYLLGHRAGSSCPTMATYFHGSSGDDIVFGGSGSDLLVCFKGGNDILDGGNNDRLL